MKIKITVSGTQSVLSSLQKRGVSLSNFSQELTDVGKYLVDFFKIDVFETEGQVIGQRWTALTPEYEYAKRGRYPGRGILEMTGALRKSFQFNVTGNKMVFKNTQTKYGPTHQFGDPSRNIPARTFFKIDKQRQEKIVDIIHKGIQKRVDQA